MLETLPNHLVLENLTSHRNHRTSWKPDLNLLSYPLEKELAEDRQRVTAGVEEHRARCNGESYRWSMELTGDSDPATL